MGRRSHGETLARIMVAFARERVWSQAELARACGITPRTLRARMDELAEAGVPLSRELDPPHVYWSVPRGWFPGGRFVADSALKQITRLLQRLPETATRQRTLALLGFGNDAAAPNGENGERTLAALEDAVGLQQVVEVDYHSAYSDEQGRRLLSVQRIFHGARVRILATCHRTNELKFFRADRILRIQAAPAHRFRNVSARELDRVVSESVNWFRATGAARTHRFVVRSPEARWVRTNLPAAPFSEQSVAEGIRFEVHTAGLDTLARYVVGLGAAASVETAELRRAVQELAREVLAARKRARSPGSTK